MQVIKEHFETKGYTAYKHVYVEVTHTDEPVVVSAKNDIDGSDECWNVQQQVC